MAANKEPDPVIWKTGYFTGQDCMENAEKFIEQFELMTLSKFSKVKCKNFKMPESNSFQGRVYWEEKSSHTLPLEFDGVPFVIIGSQVRECVNGPDRHRSEKKKHSEKQQEEHGYTVMGKKRCLLQTTKKMNCSAAIHLRYIVKFPEFKLNNNTEWVRKKQGKELKEAMKRGNVVAEHRVYVCFPSNEDHIGHLTEEFGLMSQRVDKSIISKIHMLVGEGVTNAAEMKRHLSIFCKTQHPEMPECSRRFYPSNKDIRNHMYRAMRLTQFSSEDQENLLQCVNKWKLENPSDHYFFNPSPSDTDEEDTDRAFIFVHQTWWQQVLLRRYGNEICLLDATYKTSKYDIPLFFVCVSTNVGYSIVGTFLIPNEKTESIQRGLRVLKEWNVDWKPAYFMTDYDIKEIAAIENTFPDCFTYLCDFHRMQSWDRWLRTGTNGCQQFREEIMKLLCNVAKARSESEYEESVSILKNSEYWKENKNLSTWFQKQWLSNSRRWVSCYRRTIFNVRVSTTNGLERQHQTLKASYLSGYTDGTLTCLVTCLVTRFLPDSYKRYVEYNVKSLDMCRAYTPNLPNFLHNRPKMFVKHCAQRLPPSQEHIPMENIKKQEDEAVFTIKSIDSGSCYTVDLGGALPICSCKDWEKFHLPCKHMLAILTQIEGYGWDSLNEDFRDCPHFCIDPDLKNSCHYDKKVAIPEPLTSNNRRNFSVKTDKRQTNQEELSINIDKNPQIKPKKTAIGSRCKGLSSSIHSLMFLIKKREDYEEIFQDLTKLYSKLKKMVPTEGGLRTRPVKFGRKDRLFKHGQLNLRKNKRNQRGHQSFIGRRQKSKKDCYKHGTNSNGEALNPQRANHSRQNCIIPQDSCMNITENLEESIRDTELEHLDTLVVGTASQTEIDEAEADGLVEKLWALDRDFDVPVAKVYGISVTDTDIRSLNGTRWLTDNVIDGFLEMLTNQENDKGRKILHILHSTMRGIVLGTYDPRNQRTMKLKLNDCEAVMGIYGRGSHWTLIIADMMSSTLFFFNPSMEREEEMQNILLSWKNFITRYKTRWPGADDISDDWSINTRPHTIQSDSFNCGVYCMMFAERHLLSMNMTGIDNTDLTKMRKSVASRIMLFEHYLTDCCPKCGFVIEDDDKMQCSKCHRWYHFKPYCLADDVADMNDGEEFVCRLCKVDFWPNNQLSVSALKTEEKGIVWTSRQEVMEKLQQSTKLDTDVIVIDQDTWKMDTDVYIEKGLKRKRGLRGLRQKEFLKHPRTSFVYAPLKQQKKTFQPTKSACEDGGDNSSVFKFIIPDYIHQSYSDDDDDDVCIEDGFFINSQTAIHHMTFAVSRLQCIVAVTEKQREEPWLKSHYRFLKGQSNALHGYGFVVFSPPAIETIRYNVKKIFYKNASGHVYTTAGQVEGMKDQKAKDLFAKDVFLAAEYIEQVLVKEALLAVFQSYTGCQYQEADAECLLVVNKSQRKATVDAINLCSKKKEELEKRFL